MIADHIRLNDIVLFAHLGVTQAERDVGQRIHIQADLMLNLSAAGASDALADTISYELVYRHIQAVVDASRFKLMEALAAHLVNEILEAFPVDRVRIMVRKPNVPFAGSLSSAEVEMVRER